MPAPKGTFYEFGKGPSEKGGSWDPDFADPIFLGKLERFLAAMAARYDGNPNVAFVDVGTFGLWGEGHTFMSSQVPADRTLAIVKQHIDLHRKHFPHTLLSINDDVAGHDKPGRHFPETDYALSQGLTLRDDSILVQPPPRSWYHAEMAQAFWPHWPVILEHEHYGASKERGAWGDGSLLLKAVEDYHASYLSIHWWPRVELEENRGLIERINRRLGYRLQLREITWPGSGGHRAALHGAQRLGQCRRRPVLSGRLHGAHDQGRQRAAWSRCWRMSNSTCVILLPVPPARRCSGRISASLWLAESRR